VINRLGQIIEEYEVNQPNDTNAGVLACAISPKGLFLYGLTEDGSLFCFATASKTVVRKIKVADKRAIGITHHPSKNILVEFSQDGLLKLYSPE
jgi:WD40 repeat protein